MTEAEIIEELGAVHLTTSALKKPTFIHRSNWHRGYSTLVRRGLVTWKRFTDGTFGPSFAAVALTAKGRKLLEEIDGGDS